MSFSFLAARDIPTAPPDWLWEGRIPLDAITIVEGDPGTNKSTMAYDIAARVSTGSSMPESAVLTRSGDVWLFSSEDSPSRTRATLAACGADLSRIQIVSGEGGMPIRFPLDLRQLEAALRQSSPALIVLDPLCDVLGGSMCSERVVRSALGPLCALATRYRFAVVGIRHQSKASGSNPLYLGAGSIGISAIARSILQVSQHPLRAGERVVVQAKSNLGPHSVPLMFAMEESLGGLRVRWMGPADCSPDQLSGRRMEAHAIEEAIYFLYSLLGEGPMLANEAKKCSQKNGIADRTLRRARELLGVMWTRRGFGPGSKIIWSLSDESALVKGLRKRDLDELCDKLCNRTSNCSESIVPDELPPHKPPSPGSPQDGDSADNQKRPREGSDEGDAQPC